MQSLLSWYWGNIPANGWLCGFMRIKTLSVARSYTRGNNLLSNGNFVGSATKKIITGIHRKFTYFCTLEINVLSVNSLLEEKKQKSTNAGITAIFISLSLHNVAERFHSARRELQKPTYCRWCARQGLQGIYLACLLGGGWGERG